MALTQIPQPPLWAPDRPTHTPAVVLHTAIESVWDSWSPIRQLWGIMFQPHTREKKIIIPHFDRTVFDVLRCMHALTVFHCSWEMTGNDLQTPEQLESKEHKGMNIHSTNQIHFNHATLRQTVGETRVDMETVWGILQTCLQDATHIANQNSQEQKDSLQIWRLITWPLQLLNRRF